MLDQDSSFFLISPNILIICFLNIVWILWGEVSCWSLLGFKGLTSSKQLLSTEVQQHWIYLFSSYYLIDYNLTYSFSPVELLFCFMECPGVFTIFSLKDLLFVPAHCNQFLHHGDVSLNLVMHECDLFILFLSFADGLSVAFNLCFDGLDSLSLKTV